jgi:hypothetical protein
MIPCNEIGICLGSPKIELAPSDTVSVDRARPEDWANPEDKVVLLYVNVFSIECVLYCFILVFRANPEDKVVLLYVLQTLHVRVHSLRLYCFILVFG